MTTREKARMPETLWRDCCNMWMNPCHPTVSSLPPNQSGDLLSFHLSQKSHLMRGFNRTRVLYCFHTKMHSSLIHLYERLNETSSIGLIFLLWMLTMTSRRDGPHWRSCSNESFFSFFYFWLIWLRSELKQKKASRIFKKKQPKTW